MDSFYVSRNFIIGQSNNIKIHKFELQNSLNIYAKNSLKYKNDAKKKSLDEALSIHIITNILKTRLNISYECQIPIFYGKPDFIIRLGKDFYIMVSTTRSINKKKDFNIEDSDRLIKKKINGLLICSTNLEYLVDDIIDKYQLKSILHILSPSIKNANLCFNSYKKYAIENPENVKKIKILISIIDDISYF